MRLTAETIQNRTWWEERGISLPDYDVRKLAKETKENPVWLHFGPGNIFRIFINGIAQRLVEQGLMQSGITCAVPRSYEVIDQLYTPFDNLVLGVTLKADGSTEKQVLGAIGEVLIGKSAEAEAWTRLKMVAVDPGLQMISFTITEKGYALKGTDGAYLQQVQEDIVNGPDHAVSTMAMVCALLWNRFQEGHAPIAVVSMDNCSHNGEKLQNSILAIAKEWKESGFVTEEFIAYLSDETQVSFPWTMIDKITPRPAESVANELETLGLEDMTPMVTKNSTFIAPFVNAEGPEYLVIEDKFPNGRPALEKAGVYLTDRETVNKVERMKVTTCLNPLHTALAVYGCVLGYTLIADEMKDEELKKLVHRIGPVEGMPVVTDPGILSPEEFVKEVIEVRIPNPFMPDTPQRIATDTSQKVGIRYGETIKSYVEMYGDAKKLKAIPLALAGWLRYLLAVTDDGKPFELSPDPLADELTAKLAGIRLGYPETCKDQLKGILSDAAIFGSNLYEAGIGEEIETMFLEEIQGIGAVRNTLKKYLA